MKEEYKIEMVINKIDERFPGSKYKLLYKGSRDGGCAADFHSRCDESEKSLAIVEDLEVSLLKIWENNIYKN